MEGDAEKEAVPDLLDAGTMRHWQTSTLSNISQYRILPPLNRRQATGLKTLTFTDVL